jgi:hypothetical protein
MKACLNPKKNALLPGTKTVMAPMATTNYPIIRKEKESMKIPNKRVNQKKKSPARNSKMKKMMIKTVTAIFDLYQNPHDLYQDSHDLLKQHYALYSFESNKMNGKMANIQIPELIRASV